MHGGFRSREEAFANDVRLVTASVEIRPGKRVRVHIGIVTHDRATTTMDWYPFEHREDIGYTQQGVHKPKR
jgi:hypothetical protein